MKLIKLGAKWCGPCKQQDIEFEEHHINIPVESIDIDDNIDAAIKYNASSVPKMILIDEDKSIHQWIGYTESWVINDFIKAYNSNV